MSLQSLDRVPEVITRRLDEPALQMFAADMARAVLPGDCICLEGDLGAGKSTLARAFIRALAGDETLEVPSPTFTLVQTYDLSPAVAHFDFYRLAQADEVTELGLDEALEAGVAVIEWRSRAEDHLPADCVTLNLLMPEGEPNLRSLSVNGPEPFMKRLDRSLAIRALLAGTGWGDARREPLLADASARNYELIWSGDRKRILMDAPAMPDGPPIRDGKPYSRLAHLAEDVSAFVAIAQALHANGFRAPEIDGFDLERGLVVLEHLGSGSVLNSAGAPIAERYVAAAQCLARLHRAQWQKSLRINETRSHTVPDYDPEVFLIEAELLIDWYVPFRTGRQISEEDRMAYRAALTDLHAFLDRDDATLILRDFHSPNIIWCEGADPKDQIGLIDFQDALIGPGAYDVMSLAEDARVDVPDGVRNAVIAAYCEAMAVSGLFDKERFEREAAIVAAQRACKILGIFVRLNERDGKPAYLAHLPRVEAALGRALRHPDLTGLADVLTRMGLHDN